MGRAYKVAGHVLYNTKSAKISNDANVTSSHVLDAGINDAAYRTSAVYACWNWTQVSRDIAMF